MDGRYNAGYTCIYHLILLIDECHSRCKEPGNLKTQQILGFTCLQDTV